MQKVIYIGLFVLAGFVVESALAPLTGRFTPNILIIVIVFFNLFRGIRYAIIAALLGGLLKDSFSASVFGAHIFTFIVCAYLTTQVKLYVYHVGSTMARVVIVFIIVVANVLLHYFIRLMFFPAQFAEMLVYILLPESVSTLIATPYVFRKLKQCALRLFA